MKFFIILYILEGLHVLYETKTYGAYDVAYSRKKSIIFSEVWGIFMVFSAFFGSLEAQKLENKSVTILFVQGGK